MRWAWSEGLHSTLNCRFNRLNRCTKWLKPTLIYLRIDKTLKPIKLQVRVLSSLHSRLVAKLVKAIGWKIGTIIKRTIHIVHLITRLLEHLTVTKIIPTNHTPTPHQILTLRKRKGSIGVFNHLSHLYCPASYI